MSFATSEDSAAEAIIPLPGGIGSAADPLLVHKAWDVFVEYFVGGTLRVGGSWGGEECLAHVPLHVHRAEAAAWVGGVLLLCALLRTRKAHERLVQQISAETFPPSRFNTYLATLPLGLWLYVLQSKVQLHSLCNLLQPCHISLLLNAASLLTSGPASTYLTIYSLPFTLGAWGALAIPDTSGLTELETLHFFLQHYLLVLSPLYLLSMRRALAYRHCTFQNILTGNLLISLLHWGVYQPINVSFGVNINFFLCPTPGLHTIFAAVPSYLLLPSYRTFLSIAAVVLATLFSYIYVFIVGTFCYLSGFSSGPELTKPKIF